MVLLEIIWKVIIDEIQKLHVHCFAIDVNIYTLKFW